MHAGTAAVITHISGALLLTRMQASVARLRRRTLAPDDYRQPRLRESRPPQSQASKRPLTGLLRLVPSDSPVADRDARLSTEAGAWDDRR
jgi:hypothetical protein